MELWLVRHGRTAAAGEGRFQGRCDYALDGAGIFEAACLSRRLTRTGGFDLLLSSDLKRAWSTAKIISRGIKLAPESEPLLRECSWGYIEGMKRSEAEGLFPFLFHSERGTVRTLCCGGESERRLMARTRTLRRKIFREHSGKHRILLVSHARLINAFISGCLGLTSRHRWPYAPAPASLTIVWGESTGDRYRLLLFNDVSHLQDQRIPCIFK